MPEIRGILTCLPAGRPLRPHSKEALQQVVDPYDLILSKLTRNSPVDDADVQFLIAKGVVDPDSLRRIYENELRPKLADVKRHDLTLHLWLEYFRV